MHLEKQLADSIGGLRGEIYNTVKAREEVSYTNICWIYQAHLGVSENTMQGVTLTEHALTSPSTISESTSVRSLRKFLATDCRASSGHSENQSMVQQVMRLGNCRRRDRNTSPIGLH